MPGRIHKDVHRPLRSERILRQVRSIEDVVVSKEYGEPVADDLKPLLAGARIAVRDEEGEITSLPSAPICVVVVDLTKPFVPCGPGGIVVRVLP